MRAPSPALTTRQLIEAIKQLERYSLDDSTLSLWAKTELVTPSVRHVYGQRGPGRGRLYSLDDLARVRLIMRLKRSGLSVQKIRIVLAHLEQELPEALKRNTKAVLLVDGTRGVIVRQPGMADREIPSGQFLLPLAEVVEGNAETAAALAA